MLSRRAVLALAAGSIICVTDGDAWWALAAEKRSEIHMKSDPQGAHVTFDPIGLLVSPGTSVRWICDANVHTTTAYHPRNARHSLRIPSAAEPWDSDYLLPGQRFEVTLTVEGVYDYFCTPHEMAGMVGRIIVGTAGGAGAEPFDYFKGMPEAKDWLPVPLAAQRTFPPIARILREGVVHPRIATD